MTTQKTVLDNGITAVSFDLEKGTYSIKDAKTDENLLCDSRIGVPSHYGDLGIELLRKEEVNDCLGKGEKLIFQLRDPDLYRHTDDNTDSKMPPLRLFTFSLYENNPALIIGFGLKTSTFYGRRLTTETVLSGGTLFGGAEISQPMTLNGGACADITLVQPGLSRISCNSLMLTGMVNGEQRTVVWGGLNNANFAKIACLHDGAPGLSAEDPIGVLVDADKEFFAEDTFYLDLITREPFEALERYGQEMRTVNQASPNVYDFPVVCGWSVAHISKLPSINNSLKLVEEADKAIACGITKYTPVSLRLEPDKYHLDTEQGWWDNEHFRKFEHLVPPYDTLDKWCAALEERNAVPYIYMQLGMPSDDFAREYPQYMLFNDSSAVDRVASDAPEDIKHRHHRPLVSYDYTDEEFSEHFVKAWSDIRKAGVRGVKIDYPETAWRPEGGFDDRYASTSSAYRRSFELMRKGMGEDGLIDERNLGESARPCLDVTAGLVDTQRTWGDSNKFVPEMVSRSGLRWYKNRVVFNYYSDTKALHEISKGMLESLITMNFLTSGRLDLATSFSFFTPEITHVVSRSYPHYPDAKTSRPLDAFTGIEDPQVYDLELTPDWHQIAFYNTGEEESVVSTDISGERISNAIGLDPDSDYHAYEFWSDRYLGQLSGTSKLELPLEPGHCAMISLRKKEGHPQIISTDRHLLQGWVDLADVNWDEKNKTLSGTAKAIQNESFKIVIANNGSIPLNPGVKEAEISLEQDNNTDLSSVVITSSETGDVSWTLSFKD